MGSTACLWLQEGGSGPTLPRILWEQGQLLGLPPHLRLSSAPDPFALSLPLSPEAPDQSLGLSSRKPSHTDTRLPHLAWESGRLRSSANGQGGLQALRGGRLVGGGVVDRISP